MEYQIFFTKSFERQSIKFFKKYPCYKSDFEKAITNLRNNPTNSSKVKKLTNVAQGDGLWRYRMKQARLRYDIDDSEVILKSIDLRKDIYR
jgi:mRNA-degrading endonuclease RelE of RelBE toxin-antitoxin system